VLTRTASRTRDAFAQPKVFLRPIALCSPGMTQHHAIASIAALVGEPTRAAMLLALLDGCSLPAGELARAADLSAAATSLHLTKLASAGLVTVRQSGRHRYYTLASSEVAHALESLGTIATAQPKARSLSPKITALRRARSCYDHLAGELAVNLASHLENKRLVRVDTDDRYAVTKRGARWFAEALAIDVEALGQARPLALRCLDWTERRPHVAGALGAALLARLLEDRWVARVAGSRQLRVTSRGEQRFAAVGVRWPNENR
jgi:DNA-binding transcriptional ArsR family regulator